MDCDQCGYDYSETCRDELAERFRSEARSLTEELAEANRIDERPAPDVWSALEYACHVRDVLAVQRERVLLAQVEDVPRFESMGREERVAGYAGTPPTQVIAEVFANAAALGKSLEALDDAGWQRKGVYNYPETAERSVEWIARHTIHELVHHRQDITAVADGRVP